MGPDAFTDQGPAARIAGGAFLAARGRKFMGKKGATALWAQWPGLLPT